MCLMFTPKYTITEELLANIKKINLLIFELNQRRFSQPVLVAIQKDAEAVSTYASTSIEGNPLPLTDVKQILKTSPKNLRTSELEVMNYNKILKEINKKLGKKPVSIDLNLILDVQKNITDQLVPSFQSGKLRTEPVFVNDPRLQKTIFWPPDYQDVPKLIEKLIKFINKNIGLIDPIILAGIFHKQMVIIHPFMDGNGRTTRLITKILLAQMGLNTFNLFSFENYYNKNVAKYFEEVGVKGNYYDIKNNIDFTGWLVYFTTGIIDELLRIKKMLPETIFNPRLELKTFHKKIIETIRKKSFITDYEYGKMVKRARSTRHLDFKKLISLGLIERKGKSKASYYTFK